MLALAVLMLTTGCLGAGEDAAGEPEANGSAEDAEPTEPTSTKLSRDAEAGVEEPSLEAAPDWEPGEWWEVQLSSSLTGDSFTVTRVVAGTEGEDYLVGMPTDAWDERALIFHVPGFGEVRRSDLSFEAHDVRFELLQFPLQAGSEWETSFEGNPVTASVEEASASTAELHYCCSRNISATYDASLGAISMLDVDDGFVRYEVTDHGYNYTGTVTVPHGHDLVFNHGRLAGAVSLQTTQPAPPVETLELSDDYGRVSFVQLVGPIGIVDRPISNAYVERATGPDGTTYETQHMPTDGSSFTAQFFETTELGGEWRFDHVAPGPGIAFTEGIAYHVFDIELPQGELQGDHSEHVTE